MLGKSDGRSRDPREAKAIFGASPSTMRKAQAGQIAQGFQNLARETALSTKIFR